MSTFDDFMKLDIRVGTIIDAHVFEKAKRAEHFAPPTFIFSTYIYFFFGSSAK